MCTRKHRIDASQSEVSILIVAARAEQVAALVKFVERVVVDRRRRPKQRRSVPAAMAANAGHLKK
jgi:hypothetical protein